MKNRNSTKKLDTSNYQESNISVDKKYCKDCGEELKNNEIPSPVCSNCLEDYIDYNIDTDYGEDDEI